MSKTGQTGPLDLGFAFPFCTTASSASTLFVAEGGVAEANQNLARALQRLIMSQAIFRKFPCRVIQACFPEGVLVYSPPLAHVGPGEQSSATVGML
jgi:hypothetical protein